MQDNRRLRWCLNGFGAEVEVLEPAELRKEFAESACCLRNVWMPPLFNML
ncbi:WCX domain-containing protein [Pelobacter propionicus]